MRSDVELVFEVKQGNKNAFSELVQRHQRGLLRLTLRYTREPALAEDIVQDSFIKAYRKIDLFEGRSSFKSWLYQIAMNTAKNRFRERQMNQVSIDDLRMGIEAGAETEMIRTDVKKRLRAEVDKLPDKQRTALSLRIFEDLSFKEIAEIMDCPYDTAKANYRHALLKLRDRLLDQNGLDSIAPESDFTMMATFLTEGVEVMEAEV